MNYQTIITNLYFLLTHNDGGLNEKEVSLSEKMIQHERWDAEVFHKQIALLSTSDLSEVYRLSITQLKKVKQEDQLRAIAWLCLAANADGFMDKNEWALIYKIYNKELNLKLDDVMKVQRNMIVSIGKKVLIPA